MWSKVLNCFIVNNFVNLIFFGISMVVSEAWVVCIEIGDQIHSIIVLDEIWLLGKPVD